MVTDPLWWDGFDPRSVGARRSPLADDAHVDVCIVGGGYTGLWTAYYLLERDPSMSVLVLEAERVGFGASGRNGGWVSALYPVGPTTLARAHGAPSTRDLLAALRESVEEVGRVAVAEAIDCGFTTGGTVVVARGPAQCARARQEVVESAHWGTGTVWLDHGAAAERLDVAGLDGATFNPNCARVQPFHLVRGVAAAVERRGGVIREGSRVGSLAEGRVTLENGATVRARHVIRATEAWSSQLPGGRRAVAPVYSLVVATEPLPETMWEQIGLRRHETFSEHRHLVVYGQRTSDGRLVFGGRGAPYHFGSAINPSFDHDPGVHAALRRELHDLLPVTAGVVFSHAWGGPLGIARDWHPSVSHDPRTGLGQAGGYVGDGVALTNLAGRTLADLVAGRRTPLTELPWVQHRSRSWEPEPLRWLGINAGLRVAELADREEARTGRPARLARVLSGLTGH